MEFEGKFTAVLFGELKGKKRHRTLKTGRSYNPRENVLAENWVRQCVIDQLGYEVSPTIKPVRLSLVIILPIRDSWSRKRQSAALLGKERPLVKPDWDNTGKLVSDALNGILWMDDKQIVEGSVSKWYGLDPYTELTVEVLD